MPKISTKASLSCIKELFVVFRQQCDDCLHYEYERFPFIPVTGSYGRNLKPLSHHEHETPNKLHPISHQRCGCALPVDGSSGMGNLQSHVPQDRPPVRSPRRRFICYETEQEGSGVCQLVSGPSGVSDKRIPASLEILDQPVCVSPMELDPASHQDDQKGKTNNNPDYPPSGSLPCGFRPTETISPEAVTNPSPPGISRPEKRKAVDERQQELDAHRLAIKRSRYDQKGLNDLARAILSSNYNQQHLETRYAYIQNRFLKYCHDHSLMVSDI